MSLNLSLLAEPLAVCRLPAHSAPPDWAWSGPLVAITRSADELSLVCSAAYVPPGVQAEQPWRALKVAGPLDFSLTGILASLAAPLAEAGISIFAISTYDTDYILVRSSQTEAALDALRHAGHTIA
jgi:uncharacterized protein